MRQVVSRPHPSPPREVLVASVGDEAQGVARLLLVELAEGALVFMPPFISCASAGQGEPQKWRMAHAAQSSMSSTLRPVTSLKGSLSSTSAMSW